MPLFKLLLSLILFQLAKAHGRHIILAIMGLIGLWMTHLLAQDYQNITNPKALISIFSKLISKRSTETNDNALLLDFETILSNDPIECTKSFICQTAANVENLKSEERKILEYIRYLPSNDVTKQIKKSIEIGELLKNPSDCFHVYKQCPYTAKTMSNLVRMYGD